ncbi:Rna-binding protein [Globisporangium polare]
MAHRERLLRFYQKYNADKLHEIDGVLERFKGKEASLFTALVKKYGPEPSADEDLSAPAAAAAPAQKANASAGDKKTGKKKKNDKQAASATAASAPESSVVKDFNHARLLAFYNRYNPEKVGDVPSVLLKYKGKEAQLFNALVKKYGPEPGDSDDDDDDDDDDEEEEEDDEEEEEAKPAAEEAHDEEEEYEEKANDDDDGDDDASSAPKFKTVVYCPVDTFPPEYCEYGPLFNDCKPWLAENCPTMWLTKYNRTMEDFLEAERQIAAGVEGITLEAEGKDKTVKRKGKKKQEEFKSKANALVYISKSSRKGRKRLTFVTGLEDFDGVNIKDASKSLGKRFACSASLSKTDTGKQQIQLQGDCITELMEVLPEMFGISEDRIRVVEEPAKGKK